MSRKIISILILVFSFAMLLVLKESTPLCRLMYASFCLIFLIKVASLFFEKQKFESKLGFVLYLFFWPGISTNGFTKKQEAIPNDTGKRFYEHWMTFLSGSVILGMSIYLGRGQSTYFNYLSLFSIILIIHLGLIEVIRDLFKLLKFNPNYMFDRPFMASSLRDFWSLRWNRAFVEMNKVFLLTPFKAYLSTGILTFFIFLVSGVLHEVAITYPTGSDYGKPLIYFLIQGTGFLIEKKFKLGRIGTILVIVLPIPILFPPSFVNLFLGGLADWVISFSSRINEVGLISLLLRIGALLQASVLLASIQVPGKLNWKQEFQKLSAFNRKVFWTYGGYILSIIVFMTIVSFTLSFESQPGTSFLLWIVFINIFWVARVLIDAFYYSHDDWPKGAEFVIGHICLTTLFMTLVLIYSSVLYLIFSS